MTTPNHGTCIVEEHLELGVDFGLGLELGRVRQTERDESFRRFNDCASFKVKVEIRTELERSGDKCARRNYQSAAAGSLHDCDSLLERGGVHRCAVADRSEVREIE